jgi:decaprenylphospho-beta-D-erythro-pentofuranosid-2-ulose 2-reductase
MSDIAATLTNGIPASKPDVSAAKPAAKSAKSGYVVATNRVVILGALSGMAMATARIYAHEGAAIMLVARNVARLDDLKADLVARGGARVETAIVDLEAEAGMAPEKLNDWMVQLGGLDHVLLFHGYLGEQEKAWEDKGELARILSANFTSAALWAGAAGEIMREHRKGAVVAVTSVAGDRGRQSNFAYGSAKAGLVAIKAGPTDTAMTAGMTMAKAKPEDMAKAIRRAADRGGPIQYAPGKWKIIMLIIRTVPSFVFHKTKL